MGATQSPSVLDQEIQRRRTFAIISHPDAGKTTLTEKLLLYGGAIHLAGSVKARRAARHATSDWMELEKQRGISVTSSVLQFDYNGCAVNLLDTPGHQDFSEDTYRTLTAVDSAVMLIDGAKGVERQTEKLFKVCRMRGIPIFTFVNKLDRHSREPLDLIDEIERVLGIRSCPMNWPIGSGADFRGVYDREKQAVWLFESQRHGEAEAKAELVPIDDPSLPPKLGPVLWEQLQHDIELLDVAGDPFDRERVNRGELAPMYFGSAMTNFGVEPFLADVLKLAPPPQPRKSSAGEVEPNAKKFSGFIFKIQANMNPAHRDRIAFLRIVSGKYEKGMSVTQTRTGRPVRLANPQQFMAQERNIVEEAYAGDIIGLFDPGQFRIGDTLFDGQNLEFLDMPRFSPEHFSTVRLLDAGKRKQFQKGVSQLGEEGAVQVFHKPQVGEQEPVLGAVGVLQFDVFVYRLKAEYGVDTRLEPLPFELAYWVEGDERVAEELARDLRATWLINRDGQSMLLFRDAWALRKERERRPDLPLRDYAPPVTR